MKKIDYDWLKRIDTIHDKLDRHVPLKSKTRRCTKEVLIDRYFKFLENTAYKIRIPKESYKYGKLSKPTYETFYALFYKSKHTIISCNEHDGEVYYSYGVQKYNGWNDQEFTISFRDEKCNYQEFKLHWNDILKISYEKIPLQKYWEIVGLFIDMNTVVEEENSPNFNNCEQFDEAQGKYYCTSENVPNKKCIGIDCGFYNEKK